MMQHYSGADPYFFIGISALRSEVTRLTGMQLPLQAFFFPNMRSLLSWSMRPLLLKEGLVLIAGSREVIATLKGLVDPRYVILVDGSESLTKLRDTLITRARTDISVQKVGNSDVWFTSREMSYMWAFIQGKPHQSDSKRDSGIRLRVANKIGASGVVSLLVRFRLLCYVDSHFLLLMVRMRGGRLQGRGALFLPELEVQKTKGLGGQCRVMNIGVKGWGGILI